MCSVRAKIKEATDRRHVGRPVEDLVGRLNLYLRGWGNYFKWGNSHRKFRHIDLYVYERLERFMRIKHGPRGHFGARRFYAVYRDFGSTSWRERHPGELCMPDGQRCREAGCRRTARPV